MVLSSDQRLVIVSRWAVARYIESGLARGQHPNEVIWRPEV